MATLVDTDRLATYDAEGVAPYINDYSSKKLTATVSGKSVAFTDSKIGDNVNPPTIDGPYIADVLVGLVSATISSNTLTYTLADNSANGKSAYIWLRYPASS